jgi:hypothetical protein
VDHLTLREAQLKAKAKLQAQTKAKVDPQKKQGRVPKIYRKPKKEEL